MAQKNEGELVMLDGIQPVDSLGITLLENHLDRVVMQVPLQGNLNDKMTMFAGSQFSGMVLAGWRLASNWAADADKNAPVVIKSTKMDFSLPVDGDLICIATLDKPAKAGRSGNWKLKITVEARTASGELCAVLHGDYRVLDNKQ